MIAPFPRDSANPVMEFGQVGAGFCCMNEDYGDPG
jgi:hypothetical protein